eukprot:TRINITY_DN16397_c0_g1_i19.p1 TRINITY_DN16397_c0_g1~~TRINITY_DN16397_c0_g1_i19.p1  ORF type:complete len:157 (+),score=26.96 TRINITY_DN16397_c0_g1_i19:166-636(+)
MAESGAVDINDPNADGYATAAFPSGSMVDLRGSIQVGTSIINPDTLAEGETEEDTEEGDTGTLKSSHRRESSVIDGSSDDFKAALLSVDPDEQSEDGVPLFMKAFDNEQTETSASPINEDDEEGGDIPLYMKHFLAQERQEEQAKKLASSTIEAST